MWRWWKVDHHHKSKPGFLASHNQRSPCSLERTQCFWVDEGTGKGGGLSGEATVTGDKWSGCGRQQKVRSAQQAQGARENPTRNHHSREGSIHPYYEDRESPHSPRHPPWCVTPSWGRERKGHTQKSYLFQGTDLSWRDFLYHSTQYPTELRINYLTGEETVETRRN